MGVVWAKISTPLLRARSALIVGGMRKNRFARTMGFGNDGGSHVQRHDENTSGLNRASEDLNPIGTIVNLLVDAFDGLLHGFHFWNRDVVFF